MIRNKLRKTIHYLKQYPALSILIFIFVSMGSFLEVFHVGLLLPILNGIVGTGKIFSDTPKLAFLGEFFSNFSRVDTLSILLILFFLAFIAKSLVTYWGTAFMAKQRFFHTRDLQNELFRKLMVAGIPFFDSTKSGQIVNAVYNESVRIGKFINCVLRMSAMSARIAVNLLILFVISWKFTLFSVVIFLIIRFPIYLVMKKIKTIGVAVAKTMADFNFFVLEAVSGIRVIRIFGGEKQEEKKFATEAQKLCELNYANIKRAEMLLPFTQVMFIGIFIVFFLMIIRMVKIDMVNILPYVVAYIYVSKNLLTDFTAFQDRRAEATSYLGAFDSYEELSRKIDNSIPKNGNIVFNSLVSEIKFDRVSFGYHPDKTVLEDVTLTVPKNKTTAIVGYSGTGKTTLAYLLMGFYRITKGKILVDGININDLEKASWCSKIGFVSQDVFIFNASAKENIAYGKPNATEEAIRSAAVAADIESYISSLPEGYDTILGERGVRLSGGQRQRISIARALMQNPEILILDEATSHLDSNTERQIQNAIDKLAKNRTVVVIAHRLSTVLSADNIIVLSDKRVVESGTHIDLMNRYDGYYKHLYKTQFQT